ncbi:hypothetical protein [Psychroflexus torquis]|uniref:hypothetical protein n=1 Tax=Psychroflexus torquis TaxID=57029 RepID=UPI0002ED0DEE|nr:hypothetical protein [Psychroflexus torquis]
MQRYVTKKLEEKTTTRKHLDKLTIIGNDKTEHYFFDRDLVGMMDGGQPKN